MRAVLQRVKKASVEVDGQVVGEIGPGLLVFLGVGLNDDEKGAEYLATKISGLRIFEDEAGLMNLSLEDLGYSVLAVSQFTLFADSRKGRRPSFSEAAPPEKAEKLYDYFCHQLSQKGLPVARGKFQAEMRVLADNDGPVTILLDSDKKF